MALSGALAVWILFGAQQPAWAETREMIVDMPVYGQSVSNDLVTQAELLAEDTISQQFRQDPDLTAIRVVIVGDRNGEVIPILTTTVTRSQWQEEPQVSSWAGYYSASYALLQRHNEPVDNTPVASASTRSDGGLVSTYSGGASTQQAEIDRAFDEGRLTGAEIQYFLDDID